MGRIILKTFLLVFICLSGFLFAQNSRIGIPKITNYDISEIHSGPQTWMISPSMEGLMYFANNDGVFRFDGQNWDKFPLPSGTVVRSVLESGDGVIYAGGFNEIGFFSYDLKGNFRFNSLTAIIPDSLKDFGEVWKIHEMPQGIVFQSFEQIMIFSDSSFRIIKPEKQFHFSFKVHDEIYVQEPEKGLFRLAGNRLIAIPDNGLIGNELIWAMLPHPKGILICTAQNGIYLYDGLGMKEWKNPAADYLKRSQLYCGLKTKNGHYAFGTIQNGILCCDDEGNIFQIVNQNGGLQDNTVLSIAEDQYENLWLGLDNGISYIETHSPLRYLNQNSGFSAGYAIKIFKENIYFGTNRGVLHTSWPDLQAHAYNADFSPIIGCEGQVWCLQEIDSSLFCGHNNGVFLIDNLKAEMISDVPGGWTFLQPEDRKDILLCGTYTGISRFEKKQGKWLLTHRQIEGFGESSRFLVQASKQKIWMSHGYKGIYRLFFNEDYSRVLSFNFYDEKAGLPSFKGNNVFEIDQQSVFTTDSGVYAYNPGMNRFQPDDVFNKIANHKPINFLYQERGSNIWYFTFSEAGVLRRQEDGSLVNIELPFREMENSFIKGFQFVYPYNPEHVFFASQKGFVHYNPSYQKDYKHPFQSYIHAVTVMANDSALFCGDPQGQKNEPLLPYRYNQLEFEFSANDFENPLSLLFSTYLEGFETEWTPWSERNSREFTNLKHGRYVFRVRAKNIYSQLSSESVYGFEILPPWYLSKLAYTSYAFLLLFIFYQIYRYNRMRIRKSEAREKERQQRLFREKEKRLKTQALESEKEVIKLRNEKLRAEMMQKDKELANATMQMIQKGKTLQSIKTKLLSLKNESKDDLTKNQIQSLIRKINKEIDTEGQWEVFEHHFESVHEEFLKRIKADFPDLSPRELKLCAYLRLNISSKEIATLMNISTRGVEISRYRLRRKLKLGRQTNLSDFIINF